MKNCFKKTSFIFFSDSILYIFFLFFFHLIFFSYFQLQPLGGAGPPWARGPKPGHYGHTEKTGLAYINKISQGNIGA